MLDKTVTKFCLEHLTIKQNILINSKLAMHHAYATIKSHSFMAFFAPKEKLTKVMYSKE